MSSVSIFRSDKPEGPADEGILRWEIQQKRTDPEAMVLKEFKKKTWDEILSEDVLKELMLNCCEKLGGITIEEFMHKIEIFYGGIDDDEREWREQRYGKQE